jgi:CRISPR-associated protein Csb1
MPHRLSDAILRESEIDSVPFARSRPGQRLLATKPADLSPILETSPTTLLFGCWFTQYGPAQRLKIQRCTTSEIWAYNAVLGQAVGSRIDPLGIEKIQLYETKDGDWTALEDKAVRSGDKAKPFGKKPSELLHGNIAPSIRQQGITAERVQLRWALPLAAVRRLRFGGSERESAGQAYVAALGLLARVLDHQAGYSLRSRCDLLSSGPMAIDIVGPDGEIETRTVTAETAITLFREAEDGLRRAGIALHGAIEAQPSTKLADLIKANRLRQELGKEAAE